jgi:colanic acid biosynthesis glycosyl transferase WcaI
MRPHNLRPTPAINHAGARNARVFFINRYFFPDMSATAQILTDLACGLAENGFEIHVVCSRQLYDAAGARLAAEELLRGVIVHRIWTTRFGRSGLLGRAFDYASFYVLCGAALARLLRRGDIVVAKTDPPLISIVAAAAARLKGAALVNWLQDVFPEVASQLGANPLPAFLDRALRRLRDASLRAAAANVVLGSRMLEYIGTRCIPASQCRVIENSADPDSLRPRAPGDSALRVRLGLVDKFVIGYSGNLGRAHEYDTVLGAAEALRLDGRFAFLFIGGGVNMRSLEIQVKQRGLSNFHFLPYQARENLEDSLAASDVHLASLIPTLEGLIVPSKFYGILAVGRPVVFIGDGDGELSRAIRSSRCGLVVEAGNSKALVDAINSLESDVGRRHAMGAAARELLCTRYSSKRALERWRELLAQVQANPDHRR